MRADSARASLARARRHSASNQHAIGSRLEPSPANARSSINQSYGFATLGLSCPPQPRPLSSSLEAALCPAGYPLYLPE